MIKFLRNPEVHRTLILMLVISAVASCAAYCMNTGFGNYTVCLCVVLVAIHIISTMRRYKKMAGLAADVDRILHGDSSLLLDKYTEGELGILHSEIYKMTTRLRENEQRLISDKQYLADSLADISHQLRTPLTSINLLVSLLGEQEITVQRRQKLTRELYALLSRVDWLITSLLKISKLDAGTVSFKKTHVALSDLIVKSCEPILIPMELRSQELKVDVSGSFTGDILWTSEAIGNIVKNCMEHTPDGGTISINGSENALFTQIVICDHGSGIKPEDLPHIFDRFYKGQDSDDKSFGIGLALARMIVTSQNGIIKAENTAFGAKFTLRFYKGTV